MRATVGLFLGIPIPRIIWIALFCANEKQPRTAAFFHLPQRLRIA